VAEECIYYNNIDDEMENFDKLPKIVREALANANGMFVVDEITWLLNSDRLSSEKIVAIIQGNDRRIKK